MNPKSLEMLKTLFGTSGEEFARSIESTSPEFAKLVDEVALERFWSRKGISLREKSLITISSQAALGRWDQVETHMGSFLHMGGSEAELTDIFIHLALYCGFPVAIAGFRCLDEVKKKRATGADDHP